MLVISKGAPVVVDSGRLTEWNGWRDGTGTLWGPQGTQWSGFERFVSASYEKIFESQLWVYRAVTTRAIAIARLPLKVHERAGLDRPEAPDSPLAQLLRNPQPVDRANPVRLSLRTLIWWVQETKALHGVAYWWIAQRDRGGRPIRIEGIHPTRLRLREDGNYDHLDGGAVTAVIPAWDVIPFLENTRRVSPLEPLRSTLENEAAARESTSSFWQRGARPSIAITTEKKVEEGARKILREEIDGFYTGARNTGRVMLLPEGMKPDVLNITAEDAQYIETRKLNREEVAAAYGMPPPVLGILDNATYSNIRELYRSLYRDVVAGTIVNDQDAIETYLRGGLNPKTGEANFSEDAYAEFEMGEVLRGTPEEQVQALATAIQTAQLTPAEARRMQNRRFIDGTDQLLANGALMPLDMLGQQTPSQAAAGQRALAELATKTTTDQEVRDAAE